MACLTIYIITLYLSPDYVLSLVSLCCRMLEYSLNLQSVSFSAVRTVRVLRPLRAINRVPSEFKLAGLLRLSLPKQDFATQNTLFIDIKSLRPPLETNYPPYCEGEPGC